MKKFIFTSLIVGVSLFCASWVMCCLWGVIFPNLMTEYLNKNLFVQMGSHRMCLWSLHPLVLGFILTFFWSKTKSLFLVNTSLSRGAKFGLSYLLLVFPGLLISYATSPYSLLMVATWAVSVAVSGILAGLVLEKLNP